jgi:hypothetical protein
MSLMCRACDRPLTDFEATRRYFGTHNYLDLCNHCFSTLVPRPEVAERYDLYDGASEGIPDEG